MRFLLQCEMSLLEALAVTGRIQTYIKEARGAVNTL